MSQQLTDDDLFEIELSHTDSSETIRLLLSELREERDYSKEIREKFWNLENVIIKVTDNIADAEESMDCAIDNIPDITTEKVCKLFEAANQWLHQAYLTLNEG